MSLFDYKWIDAPRYPDPIAHNTMARLTINVGDEVATWLRAGNRHYDHIEVPMSNVAEWIVVNWWHLYHEADTVVGSSRPGFSSRHDLSYAGNGFVFPRVIFRPEGERVVVSNERWYAKHAHIEFLLDGEQMFETVALKEELHDLVDRVIARLKGKNVGDVPWIEEWDVINNKLDAEEKEFCRATAMLGLDPFDIEPGLADQVTTVWNEAAPVIREELMLASDGATLGKTHEWLKESVASANKLPNTVWEEVKEAVRSNSSNSEYPWEAGEKDARAVLRKLDREPGPFSFDGEYAIKNIETMSPSSRIEGCVGEDTPSCVVVPKRDIGKKFLLARALGHYIARAGNGPAILSKLRTPEQSRARSFAAELLAPSEWLRHKVGTQNDIEPDQINDLAEELGVSEYTVQWQLKNHEIARISSYPRW
ncbi:MAG: ImmA/IrrE family metallo-endopeptidase [Rhodothermaceae bacterium]|nr:ImmA/IrrE family metallo-endopeptidase [Rhodothermaceae bacterium]MXZ18301.1 ImmA/IrrE family metallo-endopeptidase [Rhodothermaceae bacterium]MYE62352.1 ImmA/IrrE family metallo-endopeptidase [Rhodothermaceae bacterium]MYG69624.1 ImmA/IrrE family metallo-endopeptidase [Rhodothermaceae bacterium]MYJ19244.1 ImmA/IrrE family metallo-endopeptidase [Rhodothermaceae bacterium]